MSVLIFIWVYIAIKLYSQYRNSVRKSIDSREPSVEEDEKDIFTDTVSGTIIEITNNYYRYLEGETGADKLVSNPVLLESFLSFAEEKQNIDLLPLMRMLVNLPWPDIGQAGLE